MIGLNRYAFMPRQVPMSTKKKGVGECLGLQTSNLIWPSLNLNSWKEKGMPKAEKYLIDYTKHLYTKAKKESGKNVDIIEKGEDYISKHFI